MTDTQPPPYPGFNPNVMQGTAPYPQQYPQQYPQAYPKQLYQSPGEQMPGQQFTGAGEVPGQQYPFPGQQFPPQQFPPQQFPAQQYPSPQPANYSPYGPSPAPFPMRLPPADVSIKDENLPGWTGFTDKAIRAVFVRKVYSILMLQLLFTLAVIALFVFEKRTKRFVRRNTYLYYISYFIFLGVYIALVCCGNLRRKYPTNIILLSVFTAAMSYMLGTISSFYDTQVVLMAVGICAGVCLAVTVFSFHTKFDFTSCGGVLMVMVWVLFLFGILTIFTYDRIMTTVYAALGAIVFVMFLAHDTQQLMGGKKHEISPEEHIYAAMQIYLDVAYIFMFLLMIFGSGRNN